MAPLKRQVWVDGIAQTPKADREASSKDTTSNRGKQNPVPSAPSSQLPQFSEQAQVWQEAMGRQPSDRKENRLNQPAGVQSQVTASADMYPNSVPTEKPKQEPRPQRTLENTSSRKVPSTTAASISDQHQKKFGQEEAQTLQKTDLSRSRWAPKDNKQQNIPHVQQQSTATAQPQSQPKTGWTPTPSPSPSPPHHEQQSTATIQDHPRKNTHPEHRAEPVKPDDGFGGATNVVPCGFKDEKKSEERGLHSYHDQDSGAGQRANQTTSSPRVPIVADTWAHQQGDHQVAMSQVQPGTSQGLAKEGVPQPLTTEALVEATGGRPESKAKSIDPISEVSGTGVGEENTKHKDYWPIERDFRGKLNEYIWTEQDWNRTRQPRIQSMEWDVESDEGFVVSGHLKEYIKNWVQATHEVTTNFLTIGVNDHEDCDVDTETGVLLSPVDYPATKISRTGINQLHLTSNYRIDIEIKKMKTAAAREKRKAARAAEAIRATQAIDASAGAEAEEMCKNEDEIQIPCHIRPATEDDLGAIAAMYNHEVGKGHRVIDKNVVPVEKFRQLFIGCRKEDMPFIVTVDGWHGQGPPSKKIIGFALVDALVRGIMGSYASVGDRCGKIMVMVHPDYRRKKAGTAMIDVILACCSAHYYPRQGYQLVNPMNDKRLFREGLSPRRWRYLEMEVIILSGKSMAMVKGGEEYKWIVEFLEAKFTLKLVSHDFAFYHNEKLLFEKHLDRLIFRHEARPK